MLRTGTPSVRRTDYRKPYSYTRRTHVARRTAQSQRQTVMLTPSTYPDSHRATPSTASPQPPTHPQPYTGHGRSTLNMASLCLAAREAGSPYAESPRCHRPPYQ